MNRCNKYYIILGLWCAAIMFLALMDTIIFHAQSWVLSWDYMHLITDWTGHTGIRNFADGWHSSKTLMELMMATALILALYARPPDRPAWQIITGFYIIIILLTLAIHNLFFHWIFIL